jgi:hypothetical protein
MLGGCLSSFRAPTYLRDAMSSSVSAGMLRAEVVVLTGGFLLGNQHG